MTEIQMVKVKKLLEVYQPCLALFEALEHSNFGFVSDFGIRISNLFSEKQLPTGTAGGLIAIINEVYPSRHDQLLAATSP
jgi:hypothetical protein